MISVQTEGAEKYPRIWNRCRESSTMFHTSCSGQLHNSIHVIAFGAMLTSLKVKRSYSVYTRRVKSNEVFEEMLNRNNEGYYEHGFLANC
ncbi:hypothetical protein V1478_005573 [Vespula squamosa]|uniref:Uncharacterized protein n=1 Tax=Vespula squamosa TaxID=30214 RepID=A0ABD2BAG7_VESSQ